MKKTLILGLIAFLPVQSAMAYWIFPPQGKEYQPVPATEVFLAYDGEMQTTVIKPEWYGDMTKFGMVYPTPSKPSITAASNELFWQLEEATNPWVSQAEPVPYAADMTVKATRESAVEVVEEKNVAEYRVSVLKATSATELTKWLKKNGYSYDKTDTEKVEYYVKQGGYYFIALKVNAPNQSDPIMRPMSEDAKIAIEPGWWWGELSPIEISFATDKPQLPMRTLKSDNPEMVFDLYTMSEQAVYVPGVDTIWSNRVDNEFLKKVPTLAKYSPKAKWLLRQEVKFVPSKSNADVYLTQAATDDFTTVTAGSQARFNPKALDANTGIIAGLRGQVVTTDGSGNAYAFTRNLTIGSVGEDVRQLQKILNAEGFVIAKTGPGSVGNESTYFGPATKAALMKYQNFYKKDIGIQAGTGYFGPASIKFMNR